MTYYSTKSLESHLFYVKLSKLFINIVTVHSYLVPVTIPAYLECIFDAWG